METVLQNTQHFYDYVETKDYLDFAYFSKKEKKRQDPILNIGAQILDPRVLYVGITGADRRVTLFVSNPKN